MSLNQTPRSERFHISIFGRRNAGKSSIINALAGQDISLVSNVKGTTTDPVYKAMELLPIGPVVWIDTAGLDDEGYLGELRKEKALEVMDITDLAIIVIDANVGVTDFEYEMIKQFKRKNISVIAVVNKIDEVEMNQTTIEEYQADLEIKVLPICADTGKGILQLKEEIIKAVPAEENQCSIVGDLVNKGDFVVLVVPIDKAAPKGRLILPQQQTIRDILDHHAIVVVTKETELADTLHNIGKKPSLVITDSQVFKKVAAEMPEDIPLTSFSILFARYKGDLAELVRGARSIAKLCDGDKVLIVEACTHHRQPGDIGSEKIPRWLLEKTGKKLEFDFVRGVQFPKNLKDYALIVHCGGCMLNVKAMQHRIAQAVEAGVPIVNYGVLISYVQGIFERAIRSFSHIIVS